MLRLDAISNNSFLGTSHPSNILQSAGLNCNHGRRHVIATYSIFSTYLIAVFILHMCFSINTHNITSVSDHKKPSQTGTKSNKHLKILFAIHLKLFIKGFVFAPLIILLVCVPTTTQSRECWI